MTLSKRQDCYSNQRVFLFRLQYETHGLQMHSKLPCRSVVAPTPKLLEIQYALRLVAFPCQYFPSPYPLFQPISPSPSSHISSISVLHLLHLRIHPCCTASPLLCSYTTIFTADIVCHSNYPEATIRPQVGSCSLLIFAQSVAVLTTYFAISVVPHIICCRPTSSPPPYPPIFS